MGGSIPCIKKVLDLGAEFAAQDEDGYGGVHCCAQYGHTGALDYLRVQGADIFAQDHNVSGKKPCKIVPEHSRVVKPLWSCLLAHQQRTALHWAAYKNEVICTQWLVLKGLDMG
jgi:ankyrin repeat protein